MNLETIEIIENYILMFATVVVTFDNILCFLSQEIIYVNNLEFVTCGVELLRGHCTDIPADQGSYWVICVICSF